MPHSLVRSRAHRDRDVARLAPAIDMITGPFAVLMAGRPVAL
jgi:hypothetical protein